MSQDILFVAVLGLVLIMFLVVLVLNQQKRLNQLQKPRYGFLGKPLLGLAATTLMAAGLVGGLYLVNQRDLQPLDAKADKNVTVEVAYQVLLDNRQTRKYQFSAIPKVDNIEYGEGNNGNFNLFWSFVGEQVLSSGTQGLSEISVNTANPSVVEVELKPGIYTVRVLVVFEGKNYIHSEEIIL